MKKIFIIFILFGLILNNYSQTTIKRDIVKATDELYVRDSTIKQVIEANAPSSTARSAANGLSIDGNNVIINGTLDRETTINGASYNFYLGQALSRILNLYINTSDDFVVNAADEIQFSAGGIQYIWDGSYWINQATNDTLATKSDVTALIAADATYQPLQYQYTYSTSTTDSRPGQGFFRFNNATPASVTQLYVDDLDINSVDHSNFIQLLDTGSYWLVYESNSIYANYKVTGGYTDAAGYTKLNVTYQSGLGSFTGSSTLKHTLDISNSTGSAETIDSVLYSDTTGYALSSLSDSLYHADTETWLKNGGTIPKADSVRDELTAKDTSRWDYSKSYSGDMTIDANGNDITLEGDSIKFIANSVSIGSTSFDSNSVSTDTTKTTIITGENLYLNLGTTQKAGALDKGTTYPTSTTRLNHNYSLYATNLTTTGSGGSYSFQSTINNPISAQSQGSNINTTLLMGGVSNSTTEILRIDRSVAGSADLSGNIINIIDSPPTSGDVSGAVLSATVDGNERISLYPRSLRTGEAYIFDTDSSFTTGSLLSVKNQGTLRLKVTNDSAVAPELTSKFQDVVSEKVSTDTSIVGGDTATGRIYAQTAIEAIEFDKIQLDTSTQSYSEGTLYHNADKRGLSFYNDISGFTHDIGYELVKRVYNNSGATIPNGRFVRRTGTHVNDARSATIALAGCSTLDSARVYGMTTVEIANNSYGIVTIIGDLGELNTSSLSEDEFYLGYSGMPIDTAPEAPCYALCGGEVLYSDNDSGMLALNFERPKFEPLPIFYGYFEDSTISITNPGLGVYGKITNATNNLFIEGENIGFTFQGDSVSPKQDGNYTVLVAPSFQGDAVQSDLWRVAVFVDNVKVYSQSRTSSTTNKGGVPFPVVVSITAGQWISWRIANTEDGARSASIIDCSVVINYQ